jgi:hypothetical protein
VRALGVVVFKELLDPIWVVIADFHHQRDGFPLQGNRKRPILSMNDRLPKVAKASGDSTRTVHKKRLPCCVGQVALGKNIRR